jgi:hypothetical protein
MSCLVLARLSEGYGYFYPRSVYVNALVCFQYAVMVRVFIYVLVLTECCDCLCRTWLGLLAHGFLAAFIFAKAARPSVRARPLCLPVLNTRY